MMQHSVLENSSNVLIFCLQVKDLKLRYELQIRDDKQMQQSVVMTMIREQVNFASL